MDIVVWLRSLGLGKYEAAFRENEIDETVRHKLFAVIASLCTDANPPREAPPTIERFAKMSGVGICADTGAHGQCAGTQDVGSAVVDWRFLPKCDVYLGTFFSQVNGGLANGYLARNNLATTTGVRFRF